MGDLNTTNIPQGIVKVYPAIEQPSLEYMVDLLKQVLEEVRIVDLGIELYTKIESVVQKCSTSGDIE